MKDLSRTLGLVALLALFAVAHAGAQDRARLVNPKKKKPTPAAQPAPADPAPPAAQPPAAQPPAAQPPAAQPPAAQPPAAQPAPPAAAQPAAPAAAPAPAAAGVEPAAAPAAAAPTPAPRAADAPPRRSEPRPADVRGEIRERIDVVEVLLDVLVTDGRGNVVTGLGPADFVIEEEGKTLAATSVTFYGTSDELRASGEGGATRSDRYFILLFHDQAQIAPELTPAQLDAGRWTKRWVEQDLLPNDQVAVLGYDTKLKVYTDFTRDQAVLTKAVDDAVIGKNPTEPWKRASGPEFDRDSPSLLANLPADRELRRQTRKVEEALALIGRAAEGIVGRKNLMMFSLGFGDIDQIGVYTPDPRYYPDMKQSLNAGNVAVYTIDLLGSERANPAARDINDALSLISNDTGGYYYSTFVNPLTPLRQVAKDNVGYYLVSYRSEVPAGAQGYRDVKVKAKNGAYKVRSREGYRYGG